MQYIDKKITFAVWLQEHGFSFELWETVKDFPNYKVSTEGRIKNILTGSILKCDLRGTHTPRVVLSGKRITVSDIIATTFIKSETPLLYYYRDKNNQNCRLSNFELITPNFIKLRDFPNYFINNDGLIYSAKQKKILEETLDKSGVKRVWLCKGSKYRNFSVAKLVANTFIPNDTPNTMRYVEHIDGNKANDSVENLRWSKMPERNPAYWITSENTKLNPEQIPLIRKMDSVGISSRRIAATFDVSVDTVLYVLNGTTWKNY